MNYPGWFTSVDIHVDVVLRSISEAGVRPEVYGGDHQQEVLPGNLHEEGDNHLGEDPNPDHDDGDTHSKPITRLDPIGALIFFS